jgi:hypothetical protein
MPNLASLCHAARVLLAPEWQEIFETKAISMLNELR